MLSSGSKCRVIQGICESSDQVWNDGKLEKIFGHNGDDATPRDARFSIVWLSPIMLPQRTILSHDLLYPVRGNQKAVCGSAIRDRVWA